MRAVGFRCRLDIVKAREEEGKWIVEGYAATTDFDLQEDVITQEAIESSAADLVENSTVLLNHDPNLSIGKVERSEARARGLYLKILISKTVPEIWQRIKEGVLNKFSIRGRILEARKQWIARLARYARLIFKMQLVEVSLVSVPANPKARAIRWYVEKALEDFEAKGGEIEEISSAELADVIQKGEIAMSGNTQVVEEEILEGSGDAEPGKGKDAEPQGFPSPGQLQDEWTGFLKEKGIGEGRDTWEPWLQFCKLHGYPSPYPYPYPNPWPNKGVDQVISILDQLIGAEEEEETLKLLQQAKAMLDRMRGGEYPYPAPSAQGGETDPPAAADPQSVAKAGRKLSTERVTRLKKLIEEFQRLLGEVESSEKKPAGAAPEVEKRLEEVEGTLKGIAEVLGAPKAEGGQTETAGLVQAVTALKKRLDAIESTPAVKTSLDGQEALPGEGKGDQRLWKGLI